MRIPCLEFSKGRRAGFVVRPSRCAIAVLAVVSMFAVCYGADSPARKPEPKEPTTEKEFINPETALLRLYVGLWKLKEAHFSELGGEVAQASGNEEITWISDFHGIERRYTSNSDTTRYRAMGMLSFNAAKSVFQGLWVDSNSTTGPTIVEGTADAKNRVFTFTLERTSDDGSVIRYRVVERFDTPETRTSTTYLVKGASIVKQLEVTFTRTTPCPSGLRVIFDTD